jgi:hypothetical protein
MAAQAEAGANSRTDRWPVVCVLILIGLAAVYRLIPSDYRPWHFAPVGAIALFGAARMRPAWVAVLTPLVALIVSDWLLWWQSDFHPEYLPSLTLAFNYLSYAAYLALGYRLRRTASAPEIGLAAVQGSLVFFVLSNFAAWLYQSPDNPLILPAFQYERSFAGLLKAYVMGVPFYWATLASDVIFTGVLFGAYALLSRTAFPAERTARTERATV